MTALETLITELEADDPGATFVRSDAVLAIARELLTARKVVVAARSIPIGFDEAGGDATGTIKALDEALSAHDAAELARNKGDAP